MKKAIALIPVLALAACSHGGGDDWANDCDTHFSTTASELKECKARVAAEAEHGGAYDHGHSQDGKYLSSNGTAKDVTIPRTSHTIAIDEDTRSDDVPS